MPFEKEYDVPSQNTLATSTARVEQLTAELDKINANPKATTKQIVSAMDRLNVATEIQIKEIQRSLSNPVVTGASGPDTPLDTSTFVPAPAPSPTPSTPAAIPPITASVAVIATPPVKTAPIDTVLFDDDIIPIEVMTDLIFENIGGHEIINIARNDIINGQEVSYQPIKNLSSIQQQYNPNNILSLQSTSDKYFANFAIKLENKIPNPGNGPDGIYVYLDDDTGNMIVEADNLELDEQIQIEITTSGTIYEAEFGESNS